MGDLLHLSDDDFVKAWEADEVEQAVVIYRLTDGTLRYKDLTGNLDPEQLNWFLDEIKMLLILNDIEFGE